MIIPQYKPRQTYIMSRALTGLKCGRGRLPQLVSFLL